MSGECEGRQDYQKRYAKIELLCSSCASASSSIRQLIALHITVTQGQRAHHRAEKGTVTMATNMLLVAAERQRDISLN